MRTDNGLKYMIIGTGGTGGAIGAHLAHAGNDVVFIARGRQLEALRTGGLRLHRPDEEFTVYPVRAYSMDDYPDDQTPDVIFVCVKGYSIEGVNPFIQRIAGPDTIVIPILNVFGTGAKMQKSMPGITVLDGCIYIAPLVDLLINLPSITAENIEPFLSFAILQNEKEPVGPLRSHR